jgi:SAM-dependent methyltransferase
MMRDLLYRLFKGFELDRYEAVRRMIPIRDGSWFDAGCGAGILFDRCSEFGGWRAGADLSFDLLRQARAKNLPRRAFLRFNLDSPLPFRDMSFDLVTSVSSLQYCQRPADFFAEASRVLKPGGWFVLEVPNFEVFYRRGGADESGDFWRGVNTRLTLGMIEQLAAHSGFQMLKLKTAGIFAPLRDVCPAALGSDLACLLQKNN